MTDLEREDPLAAAQGCLFAVLLSVPVWALIVAALIVLKAVTG